MNMDKPFDTPEAMERIRERERAAAIVRATCEAAAVQILQPHVDLRPPLLAAATPIFIGIDVTRHGLRATLWRGQERNASFWLADKTAMLGKILPRAIDEALDLVQSSGEKVTW